MSTTLTEFIQWRMNGPVGDIEVGSTLTWDSESPLEVLLAFDVGLEQPVEWRFGRDLLKEALAEPGTPAGLGDVRVLVFGSTLSLGISSPFGDASFLTAADRIQKVLNRTFELVAAGEHETLVCFKELERMF